MGILEQKRMGILEQTGKQELKRLLEQCTEEQQLMFKRMYSHKNIDANINDVVDNLKFSKIPHALVQCERTIIKNNKLKEDNKMKDSQLLMLKMVASFLMKKNGSTTTLEIKDELRRRFPNFKWFQSDISQAMIDIHVSGDIQGLAFEDTGEFRIYHTGLGVSQDGGTPYEAVDTSDKVKGFPTSQVATKSKKSKVAVSQSKKAKPLSSVTKGTTSNLSRTSIVDLMKNSKGKFYTVTFIKKTGEERTINGQTKKDNFMDNLGYINFRESNGNHRRVNPQTIKEISIQGNVYKVK